MKATNKQMSTPLTVSIEDGQLKISIGIALLAWAVQTQDNWPEEFYVSDLRDFAKSIAGRLQREQEDGTTPVHRMLDAAAEEVLEQGDDGVDEGKVQAGLDIARSVLDGKAAEPAKAADEAAIIDTQCASIIDALPENLTTGLAIAATVYKAVLVGYAAEIGAKPETLANEMHPRLLANIRETINASASA